MIGISIFSGMENTLEENINYLNKAKKLGINKVFTSLHIPEAYDEFKEDSIKILEEANRLGMNIIADISKEYYETIDINKYNIYSLRLDFGFNNKEIAQLTKKTDYNITLNASTLDRYDIEEILKNQGNISKINACHNYYPREYTGISEELLIERNKLFKDYGIEIIAFIPSQYKKRGPIYEGLPTLEKHRYIEPIVSSQHLFKLGVDTVIIGDTQASIEELKRLKNIEKNILTIPIKLNKNLNKNEEYILNQVHTNRMDPGEYMIRSQEARKYKKNTIVPNNITERYKYSVTIDNKKYLRYEGDLQILKRSLREDKRVNVVANASDSAIIVDVLKPGDKFKFELMRD